MARRRERKRLAMQSTRKKPGQQAASGAGGQAGKAPEVLRGPKLGGSRNSRAAVRNALLEQEKAKSKR